MFVIFTTVSKADDGENIAQTLVQKSLAACVQILPQMTSVYRWENEVQRESEYLLLIKTTEDNIAEIEKLFKEIHPYDTPEFVAVKTEYVEENYLKWARGSMNIE